jgi:hypothetical protein
MADQAPDVRITVTIPGERPEELTLSYPLDPRHNELLWYLHDWHGGEQVIECRMHDDDPKLANLRDSDGRVRGIWMAACKHPTHDDRLYLRHWPNGPAGPGRHDVPHPMTELHIKGQEQMAEHGQRVGWDVACNRPFSTENLCRADVRITGPAATLAGEIQVSKIGTSSVLKRTRKAAEAGATSVWFPLLSGRPPWTLQVPSVSTNENPGGLPYSWTVTSGVRRLEEERCKPGSRFGRCPLGRIAHCNKIHPLWVPFALVEERGLAVEDIVEWFPGGGLVRLDAGAKRGVILTTPRDRETWLAFQEEVAAASTRLVVPRPRGTDGRLRHAPVSASRLLPRLEREAGQSVTARLCDQCLDALRADYLPAGYIFCQRCREGVREFLLTDPRANRLCSVCNEPLARTSIHATAHFDCQQAGQA